METDLSTRRGVAVDRFSFGLQAVARCARPEVSDRIGQRTVSGREGPPNSRDPRSRGLDLSGPSASKGWAVLIGLAVVVGGGATAHVCAHVLRGCRPHRMAGRRPPDRQEGIGQGCRAPPTRHSRPWRHARRTSSSTTFRPPACPWSTPRPPRAHPAWPPDPNQAPQAPATHRAARPARSLEDQGRPPPAIPTASPTPQGAPRRRIPQPRRPPPQHRRPRCDGSPIGSPGNADPHRSQ